MATGLIGDKAGSQRRGARQPRPSQPGEPSPRRSSAGRPGHHQPGHHQPGPHQPGLAPLGLLPRLPRPRTWPAGPPASAQPQAGASQDGARAARPQARPRTPFVLLLVGLLGGALICLLVINTTLAQGAFQITAMQQKNSALAQQAQALQQQTATEESPASIAARAEQLGLRPVGRLRFIDLKNGRIYSQPATEPGVIPVPGYTP
jgi:hypothetical protein